MGEKYTEYSMSGEVTLDGLCEYILEEFDFCHEHLYEFCMDNRPYTGKCLEYRDEAGRTHMNIPIKQLDLKKAKNSRCIMIMAMTGCLLLTRKA